MLAFFWREQPYVYTCTLTSDLPAGLLQYKPEAFRIDPFRTDIYEGRFAHGSASPRLSLSIISVSAWLLKTLAVGILTVGELTLGLTG
jgi:hypothetical protein